MIIIYRDVWVGETGAVDRFGRPARAAEVLTRRLSSRGPRALRAGPKIRLKPNVRQRLVLVSNAHHREIRPIAIVGYRENQLPKAHDERRAPTRKLQQGSQMACHQPAHRKILELGEGRSGASTLHSESDSIRPAVDPNHGYTQRINHNHASSPSHRCAILPYSTQQITSSSTLLLVDDRIQHPVEPSLQIVDSAKLPLVRVCLTYSVLSPKAWRQSSCDESAEVSPGG